MKDLAGQMDAVRASRGLVPGWMGPWAGVKLPEISNAVQYQRTREMSIDELLLENRVVFLVGEINHVSAARVMMRQQSGRIISLSSQAGFVALPTESVYCMTKAAISHLTKCLAVEWGKYNITVNAVAPTFIRTPGTEAVLADRKFNAEVIERIAGLHRIGEPMEVAGAVVFLASPAPSPITGETLMIDGGWTAR